MIHRRQLIASVAGLAFHHCVSAQAEKPIVLGQSIPLSGPSELLGIQYNQGARLYFDALNAKGGINGRTIELRRMDDGFDPERAVTNTRQFIADGVFALFGYVGTPSGLAALPLATEAKVPFFAPLTGSQNLREPFNRYAIHIRASYADETAAIIKQMTAVGIKKIAVLYQNDGFGKAGLDDVIRAMVPMNLKPVAAAAVERNSSEVAQAVKAILIAGPEAIVQIGSYKGCASFVRTARRAGYGGNFYNISFVDTQSLSDELGAVARGVIVSQVMPFPYTSATPVATEYLAALQASGLVATGPNYSGIEGYIAAKVFSEAVRRTGKTLTREGFLTAIQSMQNFNVGGMTMEFGPQKNVGSKFVEMTMLTDDGKIRR